MDTSTLENIAEDLISHKLQLYGLLVAKPKSDRFGTDLLVFSEIADNVKFCRIQNKGRSFRGSPTSNIKICKNYVTNGFLCVLYLEFNDNFQDLFIFFPNEIRNWNLNSNDEYQLNLSKSTASEQLKRFRFESSKIGLIKMLIKNAETQGEFKGLVQGFINITEENDTVKSHGSVK